MAVSLFIGTHDWGLTAIRPFTIGRKNFVIIESDNDAKASAMLYSLAKTAKTNLFDIYLYILTTQFRFLSINDRQNSSSSVILRLGS